MKKKVNNSTRVSVGNIRSNAGLTLLELLVAIVVLSVLVIPVLHSFTTSAKLTMNAKKYGEASDCAKNIMEIVDSYTASDFMKAGEYVEHDESETSADGSAVENDVAAKALSEEIRNDLDCDGDFTLDSKDPVAGEFIYNLTGLNSGASKFSAKVTFSEGDETANNGRGDDYHVLNTEKPVVDFQRPDLVIAQSGIGDENPDVFADVSLSEKNEVLHYDADNPNHFKNRVIVLNISKVDLKDDNGNVYDHKLRVNVRYLYHYSFFEPQKKKWTEENVDNFYAVNFNVDLHPDETKRPYNINLLYYPLYEGLEIANQSIATEDAIYNFKAGETLKNNGNHSDLFIIQNLDNIPVNLFLVKQTPLGVDLDDSTQTNDIHLKEFYYKPLIKAYYADSTSNEYNGDVYSNANVFLDNPDNLILSECYMAANVIGGGNNMATGIMDAPVDSLINNSLSARAYKVIIDITDDKGNLVGTFDNSKLN